ncbi:inner membrane protein [Pseudomonas alcaligenes]|nr:inner membrane protein [Pseudomonas alcaligenes]
MIVAHLPTGYLIGALLERRFRPAACSPRLWLAVALLGAFAPDLDMLYFHLVDGRQHHHHSYWSHWPVVWFGALALALAWQRLAQQTWVPMLLVLFTLNGCVHLLLDSVVGDIWWLAPWVDQAFSLATVTPRYQPWWLNFILHGSFLLELSLLGAALWLARLRRRGGSTQAAL